MPVDLPRVTLNMEVEGDKASGGVYQSSHPLQVSEVLLLPEESTALTVDDDTLWDYSPRESYKFDGQTGEVFTYAPDPTDTSATVRLTGNTRGANANP